MELIKTDKKHYENIADKIRELTNEEEAYKPADMPTGIEEVYDAGKKAEYDRFWDEFQQNGNKTDCLYMFAGVAWNAETFKPKYKIYPERANQLFIRSENLKISLPEHLASLGVELDFSRCVAASELMSYSGIYEIGKIDARALGSMNYVFSAAQNLKTIEHLILKDDGTQGFNEASFRYCYALENIKVSGVIGQSGMNLQWSEKLSAESIISIVEHLSDTATGKTITFSQAAIDTQFGFINEQGIPVTWDSLVATKPNWTFILA